MDLFALLLVGSSWTRDQTSVPCTAKQILNHWTTREALQRILNIVGIFLVVQWLKIRLATQGTQIQSLIGERRSYMPRGN